MVENRHLRYFLEVAKTLHMTRAAEGLHIAQPALTQNMHQLEAELGVRLFDREGRRLSLTAAGLVFVEEARKSLRTFEGAQLAAQRAARGEGGEIAIGFQSTAGLAVIPKLLKELGNRYPEIKVVLKEMGSSAQKNALRQAEIDVGILYSLPDREFAHHMLVPESLVVAIPEVHALAARESISMQDLRDEIFVLPALESAELLRESVMAECADAGFKPYRIQDITTAQTALGLVSVGFGISILPASIRFLERPGVVIRPIRNSRLQAQLTLMWSPTHPSPIIPKLKECLD
ncbi:LysR family transcriptional regulator [Terriglobus roseus]|uniref:Transcriptional regulator, LysR family n=1 Tax=Terriglobus roseus TaxID=392734 RepID=A0A1H4RPP9_9BACT|nr:LysR family transcriptional regulator [Terriglobus roseus]SEC33863.1 transcriptional regulator, LysR family [Terriglobus roseus]